jgi:anaerobic selenocysteine-containing dehydrogenase
MNQEFFSSACPHDCPSTCALEVERLDAHTIGRVRGAADNDYTLGVICDKVSRYRERIHNPDRLGKPLKRLGSKGSGRFAKISWDEALDEVADAFKTAEDKYGAEAIWPYHYSGTMGLVQRDSMHRFRHTLGYSGLDETICVRIAQTGWKAGIGVLWGTDAKDMMHSDLIIIWGSNPVSTQVNVMTHVTRARKQRGAKVVCIDPYRTQTAKSADIHLALRPGTDGALACGILHVLFKEGFADREYMARYTESPDKLEKHLENRTPAWAAKITGIAEHEIIAFARLYGTNKRSYIRVGYGFSRSRNGAANVHAVTCLPAVTGAWLHPGGGALYSNSDLYKIDQTTIKGLDAINPKVRNLDLSRIGPVLCGDKGALKGGPPVKAMLIQNQNPVMVAPDSKKVLAGLKRDDLFVCVHEQFMTETAELADIVLPATMFLEHDDMYKGGGHSYLQVTRKVIEPYDECWPNHDVLCALAKRLGANHKGFTMTAWQLIDQCLRVSGLGGADEAHEARWLDFSKSTEELNFLNGFPIPGGRFRFSPDWSALGVDYKLMPLLPDHMENIDSATQEYPFRLVTAPARRFLNSTFTESKNSVSKEGRPTALINLEDCLKLGLAEGELVRLGNSLADVLVHACPFNGLQPGVVVVEGIWPNKAFIEGLGINALVSSDPAPPAGGAVFHDTAVWMRKEVK